MDKVLSKPGPPVDRVIQIDTPPADDWLSTAELDVLTPPILVDRVRNLRPLLEATAPLAERGRRPVADTWTALRRSGIFYHFVPKLFGGLEFELEPFVTIGTTIGESCASTAWVTSFCMEHNWIMAQFPLETQQEVFGNHPYIIAPGTANPIGRATRCPGGLKLSGRWRFASGIMNADWAMVLAIVEGEETPRWFLVQANDITVLDTWHMDGLSGTGSNDILVQDVIVPEHRTVSMTAMGEGRAHGARLHDHWLYRMPAVPFLALTTALPAIGAAQGALARFSGRMTERIQYMTGEAQSEKPAAQLRLAALTLDLRCAENLIADASGELAEIARNDRGTDIHARIRLRALVTRATHIARQVAVDVVAASGASAHRLSDPLQRAARDTAVICTHALHDQDLINEQFGRVILGLQPTSAMI